MLAMRVEDEAEVGEVEEGLPEGLVALDKLVVVDLADALVDRLCIPECSPGLGIDGVLPRIRELRDGPVAEGLFNCVPGEYHLVAIPCQAPKIVLECNTDAIFCQPNFVDLDIGWDLRSRKVLLPRRRIRTLHTGTAIAQHRRIQPRPAAVRLILDLDEAITARNLYALAAVDGAIEDCPSLELRRGLEALA
ncbi:hypothetical protein G7046_g3152 [Stylonectria norvegica]|nr:hypothetical protein G7046_g3152 [Stylonectria norvegica]